MNKRSHTILITYIKRIIRYINRSKTANKCKIYTKLFKTLIIKSRIYSKWYKNYNIKIKY
mgnify:CR=1 FL=1